MRTRIVALAVLTSVLATCLFAIPLAVAVRDYVVQHERGQLVRTASYVAIDVSGEVYEEEPIDLEDLERDEDYAVAVYDGGGDRLAGAVPGDHPGLLSDALDGGVRSRAEGDLLVAAFPVTHADGIVGAVLVATPRSTVLWTVGIRWAAMAGLAAAAVAVAWLVGRWQARRLAGPLEDLEESARRLGDGDFSVRSHRGGVEEIDAVGAALDATAMRLDALLARERAFSADASHQLRTPLAGMRLRLEVALERPDADPRPAIAATLVDADRLEAIIDELLTLARAGQRGPTGRVDPLDLDRLIGELSPEWGARLALHGRDLAVRVEPNAPDARASGAAVRQVLGVLVDNAVTHGRGPSRSPSGRPPAPWRSTSPTRDRASSTPRACCSPARPTAGTDTASVSPWPAGWWRPSRAG